MIGRKRMGQRPRSTRQSPEQLAAIVESSDDAIIGKSLKGVILSWNDGAEKIYGYSAEEMVGKSIAGVLPSDRLDELQQILERIHRGERVEHYETVRIRKDGRCITVSLTVSPIKDAAGRIVGASTITRDVSERQRMADSLHAASQYARSLIEASLDPLVTISPNGLITDVNDATEHVTGVPRDRLIGSSFSTYFTEPHRAEEGYQKVLAEGLVRDYPLTIRHVSGRTTDVLYNASVYRNQAGEVQGVFAAARDITERNRMADSLRAASLYARSLIEASLDPLVTISPDGLITDVNEATEHVTGAPRDRLIGSDFSDYFTEPERARAGYRQVFSDGLVRDYPLTIRRVMGRTTDVLYNATVYRNEAGQVQGVFAAARDVTELKRAEAELAKHRDHLAQLVSERTAELNAANRGLREEVAERKRAEEALRESEDRLSFALETSHIGAWDLDLADHTAHRSLEHDRIFGYEQLLPQWTYEMFLDHVVPEDRATVDAKFRQATAAGSDWSFECRIRRVDGEVRWIWAAGRHREDGNESARRMAGIVQDITDRKLIEEERAQQARLKDEFLALLSHELRNPLAAISTATQLLGNGVTAERRASLNEMIGRQVKVLQRLVDDLLDLARITHGQMELSKEPIDLALFLERAATVARSSVAGRGQELFIALPSECVRFMADEVRLEQIAVNLLDNASKYTGRGGRIELSGFRDGSEVVIRCKDNGRGIPLDMQKMIFEPFARVQLAGECGEAGAGIGLALVKRLVELHGGTVAVESGGPGKGSEFVVRLPLVEPPPAPAAVTDAAPAPRARRALSIVVVEDNPDVAHSLAIGLEQAGHRATVFADGPSALSGLSRRKPHAVLLDIGLPGMNGYELAARLRTKPNLGGALFIALSGFKRRTQAGKAHGEFDHYFVKPVKLDKLLALVESHAVAKPAAAQPLRVLLVEDNAELAGVTAQMLRGEGLEVRIAYSGAEALETAVEFRPRLTLCDMHLPDMSGGQVVQALRSKAATRGVRAVILTGLGESEVRGLRRRANAMRIDEFVSKPLTRDKLRTLLNTLESRGR